MFMRKTCRFILFVLIAILSFSQGFAQLRQYKHLPDFDYADYDKHLKFMNTPFAMVGQTLYLQDVPDSALNKFFFVGNIAIPEKDDDTGVLYYKLSRMSPERIQSHSSTTGPLLTVPSPSISYSTSSLYKLGFISQSES